MKKIILFPITILVLLTSLYFLIIPLGISLYAITDKHSEVGNPPDSFTEIQIETEDNIKLAAWYKEPENNKVVILVHGSGNNRENVRNEAVFLSNNKFGVLALDLRGFGESEGKTNSFGWESAKDIKAAVQWIKQKENYEIYGWGKSMGAEVLLSSASENPEITKIISDGATYRFFEEFNDLKFTTKLAQNISMERFKTFYLGLLGNTKPTTTISNSIKATTDTKFLFIAAGNIPQEIKYNEMFNNLGKESELWIIEDVNHTEGFTKSSEDYENRVLQFFD